MGCARDLWDHVEVGLACSLSTLLVLCDIITAIAINVVCVCPQPAHHTNLH